METLRTLGSNKLSNKHTIMLHALRYSFDTEEIQIRIYMLLLFLLVFKITYSEHISQNALPKQKHWT